MLIYLLYYRNVLMERKIFMKYNVHLMTKSPSEGGILTGNLTKNFIMVSLYLFNSPYDTHTERLFTKTILDKKVIPLLKVLNCLYKKIYHFQKYN